MSNPNWSAEDDAKLAKLVGQGMSGGQLARELKKTRNAVIGRAWRMGLKLARDGGFRKWTPALIQRVNELRQEGLVSSEIAERLGTTRQAVNALAKREELPPARRAPPPETPVVRLRRIGEGPSVIKPPERATDRRTWPAVSLTERGKLCAFPVGGSGADTRFCGGETDEGQAYCAFCRRIMYTAPATAAQRKDAARGFLRAAGR